ncbi:MAG: hydantoinase B/oxoprolinase family protein [Pseudomonadota bacterium]
MLKLYERGRLNDTLTAIIGLNVRVPDRVLGDLKAQYAACQVGAREFTKLLQRYGARDAALLPHRAARLFGAAGARRDRDLARRQPTSSPTISTTTASPTSRWRSR